MLLNLTQFLPHKKYVQVLEMQKKSASDVIYIIVQRLLLRNPILAGKRLKQQFLMPWASLKA